MYDTGSTTFMLICTMLVFLMTPGLAFFYGGLSRRKNVINTMLMCFGVIGLVGVLWIVAGWSLAYGGDGSSPFIGGFDQLLCLPVLNQVLQAAEGTATDGAVYPEIVNIARKLDEMGFRLYATDGTAREISRLGTDVEVVGKLGRDNRVFQLLESGRIDYVILTGSTEPEYIRDFIHLNHRCVQLGIPCLTSLDTAGALTDILASRYNQENTELVDICHLRTERQKLPFAKMQTCGNDYIFLENFSGEITCPESLCVTLCDRHYGIGADGIILMEGSRKADAKMRMFNADGSEGSMAGNALRCMAKYLYDNGIVRKEEMTLETDKGTKTVRVYTTDGRVTSACVDMGYATLDTTALRLNIPKRQVVNYPVEIKSAK